MSTKEPQRKLLATVAASVLRLYNVNTSTETVLGHVACFNLASPIIAMQSFKRQGKHHESFLLLFDSLHLSIVEFCPVSKELVTIALFHLGYIEVPPTQAEVPPVLTVDPENSCALIVVHQRYAFLLPLCQVKYTPTQIRVEKIVTPQPQEEGGGKAEEDMWGDESDDEEDEKAKEKEKGKQANAQKDDDVVDADVEGGGGDNNSSAGNKVQEFASPIVIDIPEMISPDIRQIRDAVFVKGFKEPTICFLSESESTWAGRAKFLVMGQNKSHIQANLLSCQCSWVSFDTKLLFREWGRDRSGIDAAETVRNLRPRVEKMTGLPFSASQLFALDCGSNLQSVLCTAANSLLYVSTKRCFAAKLNGYADEEGEKSHNADVEWADVAWANGKRNYSCTFVGSAFVQQSKNMMSGQDKGVAVMAATRTGDLFSVLFESSGNFVKNCRITLLNNASTASTLSLLDDNMIFLGSALGDSMVVETNRNDVMAFLVNAGPIVDATIVDTTTADPYFQNDNESNENAGTTNEESPEAAAGGEKAAERQKEKVENPYAELLGSTTAAVVKDCIIEDTVDLKQSLEVMDLVSCVGYEQSGKLCISRQNVRTDTVVKTEIDATAVFGVDLGSERTKKRKRADGILTEDDGNNESDDLSWLFFSTPTGKTFIVGVGQSKIRQLPPTATGFCLTSKTVYATSLAASGIMCQVTNCTVFLRQDYGSVQRIPILVEASGDSIRCALTHQMSCGTVKLYLLTTNGALRAVPFHEKAGVDYTKQKVEEVKIGSHTEFTAITCEEDFLFCVTTTGGLVVAQGPSRKLVFSVEDFNLLPKTIFDDGTFPRTQLTDAMKKDLAPPVIEEILCARLSHQETADEELTFTLLTSHGECVVYSVAVQQQTNRKKGAAFSFFKVHQKFIDRERVEQEIDNLPETLRQKQLEKQAQEQETVRQTTQKERSSTIRLQYFEDLGGYDGIYVCGIQPYFIFSNLGEKIIHPHQVGGGTLAVRSFSPVNSSQVQHGYVICAEGAIQFGQLDDSFDYRQEWPTYSIPLHETPHFVAYSQPERSVVVATSAKVPFRLKKAPFDVKYKTVKDDMTGIVKNSGEPIVPEIMPFMNEDDGKPLPSVDRYKLKLFSVAEKWEEVDDVELLENEQVLCCKELTISGDTEFAQFQKSCSAQNIENMKMTSVIVVGTAFPLGEDIPSRGRLLIFGVTRINGSRQLRLLCEEGCKGPVTAITNIAGYIAAAVGATVKLYYFHWAAAELKLCAFFFAGLYVAQLESCKNYLLISDAFQSLTFLKYNFTDRTLKVLARDHDDKELLASNMLFRNGAMALVTADARRNIVLFKYTPKKNIKRDEVVEASLQMSADFRLSGCVHWMTRLRVPSTNRTATTDRSVIFYSTREGEVGFLQTISEKEVRPIDWSCREMLKYVPSVAGLHRSACRSEAQEGLASRLHCERHVTDGDELQQFLSLSEADRIAVAKSSHVKLDRILNILYRLESDTKAFF